MASERFQLRIDRSFAQIDEAVDQHNWAVARDRAQAVLTLDSGNADAINLLGRLGARGFELVTKG